MEINEVNSTYDFYLLIPEICSKTNSGTLIRSASAFNCKKIILLTKDKKILKKFFGSQGTVKKMQFEFMESIEQVKQFCIENSVFICGVEKNDNAFPIQKKAFKGNTLFILGNTDINGLSTELKDICEQFTYIEQYACKDKPLNLSIVGSIVFHHYAQWAGYQAAGLNSTYNNEKYVVKPNVINKDEKMP